MTRLSAGLLAILFVGCGGGVTNAPPDAGAGDAGFDAGVETRDAGPITEPDAGEPLPDAGPGPVVRGAAQVFRALPTVVLLDTARPADGVCGVFASLSGSQRRLRVDVDDCPGVPAEARGLVGSLTVDTTSTETLEVRLEASDAAFPSAPHVVGPLQTNTHGFLTQLGADRAFIIEVPGTATADVRVELTAVLVPESAGGDYVHLLPQPVRWLATNPNDDGFRDIWTTLDQVLRYPVVGAAEGATAMFGAVHLGPHVWRSERVAFHLGASDPSATSHTLPRWSSVPVDGHFPWRYSSFFLAPAGVNAQVEVRGSAAVDPFDTGLEPWVDAVGYLSPNRGLVYRPLSRPLVAPSGVHHNDEDVTYSTGLTDVEGVTGTLSFELPDWPYEERNRWFFVHVARDATAFPGALGGGLEGPDWMTAGLNQNGRVTVRFTSRVTSNGQFVMRHYSYVAGGSAVSPAFHAVTVQVRIDGLLTIN